MTNIRENCRGLRLHLSHLLHCHTTAHFNPLNKQPTKQNMETLYLLSHTHTHTHTHAVSNSQR